MFSFNQGIIYALQELFFPARCLGCEKQLLSSQPPLLCDHCLAGAIEISAPLRLCCGRAFAAGQDYFCDSCSHNRFAFNKVQSLFRYQEPVSTLLIQLKFGRTLTGLASIAALAQNAASSLRYDEPDIVVPVPLHIQRLRDRGFNQSLFLARACFPEWRKKIRVDLLRRDRPTVPQTHLSGKARRSNLKKAFSVRKPHDLVDKHILLLDDVFTTGSTLHECAKVLQAAGAAKIEAVTIARPLLYK